MKKFKKLWSWAFLAGVVIALLIGVLSYFTSAIALNTNWIIALVIIGIIVGLLNVTGKEVLSFLLSGAVLIIASTFGSALIQGVPMLPVIFNALLAIFVPSTIVVAIKNVFSLAKN